MPNRIQIMLNNLCLLEWEFKNTSLALSNFIRQKEKNCEV